MRTALLRDLQGTWQGLVRAYKRAYNAIPMDALGGWVGPLLTFALVSLLGALFLI